MACCVACCRDDVAIRYASLESGRERRGAKPPTHVVPPFHCPIYYLHRQSSQLPITLRTSKHGVFKKLQVLRRPVGKKRDGAKVSGQTRGDEVFLSSWGRPWETLLSSARRQAIFRAGRFIVGLEQRKSTAYVAVSSVGCSVSIKTTDQGTPQE